MLDRPTSNAPVQDTPIRDALIRDASERRSSARDAGAHLAAEVAARTPVVFVPDGPRTGDHRQQAVEALARRIARLRGSPFLESLPDPASRPHVYAVPVATLVGGPAGAALGIQTEADLYGGLVPYAVQAGKTITHGLVDAEATRPEGWSPRFGDAIGEVVLSGFSAFDSGSARRAGRRLLEAGTVRLKPGWADGGHGQTLIDSVEALDAAIGDLDPADIARHGLVLEEDLADPFTFSVGQVRLGDTLLSYVGRQDTTTDNDGATAYGGSTLMVLPGAFDRLLALKLDAPTHRAVECALVYDRAAMEHFPGLIASRRNYDVISGRDARGAQRIGVLEQSWRIGGASGAEIAAFEAFHDDPGLGGVRAACVERYGEGQRPPQGSFIYYRGDDADLGPLVKYATIETRYRAS
ncbi:DUF3182 family protein [Ancylobacter sp. Lp-2]|uniref:DUF3182 family protein n=1 Tax=Ancylobacter sp. Lp-2 TaxID=2881339 RepID=UPI001E3B1602|nr:DUF3182 family protein [Ancylobacter sp. Lp-2]MCB4768824.1 DUF3182 family protein [Ancylobacter sp. Lp-2]